MTRLRTAIKQDLDQLCVTTIRTLAIDAIQRADSGHPGTPMGMAPTVYCLWQRILRFDPQNPIWPNRDRFVLSSGHASMLLYTMLHLTGTKAVDPDYEILGKPSVTMDDLKTFRQLGSRCAGHPEITGPQGSKQRPGRLGREYRSQPEILSRHAAFTDSRGERKLWSGTRASNNVFGARLRITSLRADNGPGVEFLLSPRTAADTRAKSRLTI
jgi:hypothetical protein